ncbi:prepilin peptidase [bacterium]|nr:prepilin peptidase [bacterium]
MVTLEEVIIVTFGLMIGSFLNVCIYRIPLDLSIILPRSFCPHCKTIIKLWENIPVLSYIFLKGKCRHCQKKNLSSLSFSRNFNRSDVFISLV